MRRRRWEREALCEAVRSSISYRQVLAKLGLRQSGGNYVQVRKYIAELGLHTAHFLGSAWARGTRQPSRTKLPLEVILVAESAYQSSKLKKRLFSAGLKSARCEECGWARRTADGYLPLELDHVNGNRFDNRIENLRILCPNCHSLKPTHRGRNIGKTARVVKLVDT